jgi:hypothetical protein
MPGLMPGIHVLLREKKDVDGRDKPGHDEIECRSQSRPSQIRAASAIFYP